MIKSIAMALAALAAVVASGAEAQPFALSSPDITEGGTIAPAQVSDDCGGGNISPALHWQGAPAATRSFALTVYDPDAPTGSGFWHWILYDLPPGTTGLKQGAGTPDGALLPDGARQNPNDHGIAGYSGPCPPAGDKPHRYRFTLFAVDVPMLPVAPNATAAVVGFTLHFHTLAQTVLTGYYGR